MRKSIKRNLAYDDQKDLYYVTMHYGMRPDGLARPLRAHLPLSR